MEFDKKLRLTEVLVAVKSMNREYDARKILEDTSADQYRDLDPSIASLLEECEETAYNIRQKIINQITSMPEFRSGAVN
jgi:hypothetical protein